MNKIISIFLAGLLGGTQAMWLVHHFPGWHSWLLAMVLAALIGVRQPWRVP